MHLFYVILVKDTLCNQTSHKNLSKKKKNKKRKETLRMIFLGNDELIIFQGFIIFLGIKTIHSHAIPGQYEANKLLLTTSS